MGSSSQTGEALVTIGTDFVQIHVDPPSIVRDIYGVYKRL